MGTETRIWVSGDWDLGIRGPGSGCQVFPGIKFEGVAKGLRSGYPGSGSGCHGIWGVWDLGTAWEGLGGQIFDTFIKSEGIGTGIWASGDWDLGIRGRDLGVRGWEGDLGIGRGSEARSSIHSSDMRGGAEAQDQRLKI